MWGAAHGADHERNRQERPDADHPDDVRGGGLQQAHATVEGHHNGDRSRTSRSAVARSGYERIVGERYARRINRLRQHGADRQPLVFLHASEQRLDAIRNPADVKRPGAIGVHDARHFDHVAIHQARDVAAVFDAQRDDRVEVEVDRAHDGERDLVVAARAATRQRPAPPPVRHRTRSACSSRCAVKR